MYTVLLGERIVDSYRAMSLLFNVVPKIIQFDTNFQALSHLQLRFTRRRTHWQFSLGTKNESKDSTGQSETVFIYAFPF